MLIKSAARALIQQYFDDPSAKRWSAANLDALTGLVLDDLWTEILDAAPYVVSQYDAIPVASLIPPGYVDLRTNDQGGQLSHRFYRMQQVIMGDRLYFPKDPRDYFLTATVVGSVPSIVGIVETSFTYQFLGNQLWLHPLSTSTPQAIELRYNFRPPEYTSIADAAVVSFPEGHDSAYIYAAAAQAMMKGGVESSAELLQMAAAAKERLLSGVRRAYHGATVPYTTQTDHEWGGI